MKTEQTLEETLRRKRLRQERHSPHFRCSPMLRLRLYLTVSRIEETTSLKEMSVSKTSQLAPTSPAGYSALSKAYNMRHHALGILQRKSYTKDP